MTECGMPLIIFGAIDQWITDHPEVKPELKGLNLEEMVAKILEIERRSK